MDKLQEVKQESETDKLQEQPMEQVEEVHQPCDWVNERGKRIGQLCGKKAFLPDKYCSAHMVSADARAAQIQETKIEQPKTEEIVVKIKTSEQNLEVKTLTPVENIDLMAKIKSVNDEIARLDEEERIKNEALKLKSSEPMKKVKQTKVNNTDILEIMRNYSATMAKLSDLLNR